MVRPFNSIHQALQQAALLFNDNESARLDAEVLLSDALDKPRSFLHARPETILDADQSDLFSQYVERRSRGEPVAYITGRREFRSMSFSVTPETLIPRPETELLVETALEQGGHFTVPVSAVDLGTGTGCIALSLALERPDWDITATDISRAALAVARSNADSLGVSNVRFVQSDWFEAVAQQAFDLVISNPPYVPDHDPHLEQGDVRFEPRTALAAGEDGLDAIRVLLREARHRLTPDGALLLEIGYDQAEQVNMLARQHGYKNIRFYDDLSGIPRILAAQPDKR